MGRERRRWLIVCITVMAVALAVFGGYTLVRQYGLNHGDHAANQAVSSRGNSSVSGAITPDDGPSASPDTNADTGKDGLVDPAVLAGLNEGVDDSYPGDGWFCNAAGEKARSMRECTDKTKQTETQTNRVMLEIPQRVQERSYWCMPAALQMILAYHGIDVSQATLAERMNARSDVGTVDVDLARVANAYLFGAEDSNPSGDGYHVQAIDRGDTDPAIASTFASRVKEGLSAGYPPIVTLDIHVLYPEIGHASHAVVIVGYDAVPDGSIAQYYFIDPYYKVQDADYGGLKTASAEEMINAIVTNKEPAYIW